MTLRKVIKNRAMFPSDEAVFKILYLALKNISKRWTMPIQNWSGAMNQFATLFENRLPNGDYQNNSFTQTEAILFASVFTGVTSAIYHTAVFLYRRQIKKNQELISISKLDAELWKIFSKYIRSKDADWKGYITCFTCSTTDYWRAFACWTLHF